MLEGTAVVSARAVEATFGHADACDQTVAHQSAASIEIETLADPLDPIGRLAASGYGRRLAGACDVFAANH